MPPRKHLRPFTQAAAPPPKEEDAPVRILPTDLLLEIIARTDAETIVRCAATSKPLRRDILRPDFIRRVCHEHEGVVPAFLLGFVHAYDKANAVARPPAPFSLVHPETPAAASFSKKHILRPLSRSTGADLLRRYEPLTSRHGLIALSRQHIRHDWRTDICVYDPFTGVRKFFSGPPDINYYSTLYVLLTAADGVGCSFLLLAMDYINVHMPYCIKIQTVSSGTTEWEAAMTLATHPPLSASSFLKPCCDAVVLGTSIHCLMYGERCSMILTYKLGTTTVRSIKLPTDRLPKGFQKFNLHLASSPDGRLRLLVSDRLKVSVWLLLPTGDGWERQCTLDMEAIVSSLVPDLAQHLLSPDRMIEFVGSGVKSGAILLRPSTMRRMEDSEEDRFVLLDLETMEMRRVIIKKNHWNSSPFPYEVDLASRLAAMKIFS
ncbi:hypothetical protein QOZ80_3BG0269400 [Eleusine coracana subsp. coracana]|nr:hypothetical protein QOZ80_3BG0269400 [Eleusine coracana subsp. coracana]